MAEYGLRQIWSKVCGESSKMIKKGREEVGHLEEYYGEDGLPLQMNVLKSSHRAERSISVSEPKKMNDEGDKFLLEYNIGEDGQINIKIGIREPRPNGSYHMLGDPLEMEFEPLCPLS